VFALLAGAGSFALLWSDGLIETTAIGFPAAGAIGLSALLLAAG
jgi:hypothetical protein